MRRTPVLVAGLVLAASAIYGGATELIGPSSPPHYVIAAAGDIVCDNAAYGRSSPSECQYDDTARLIDDPNLTAVLTLGDNQYESGAYDAYRSYFDPTWGRAFDNLRPAPGNHEYGNDPSATPSGYFRYFGRSVKGPDGLGYYSYNLGACPDQPCWHFIALNSELCFTDGGCGPASDPSDPGPGNRQYAWLERDLATHPDSKYPCTLAYWHHPRFSNSTASGATETVGPLWELLYAASADIVLNGHSHNYERWRPQDPSGDLDTEHGIREFIVGTGGKSHYALQDEVPENLAVAQANAFGVLRLTLKPAGYRWRWVSARGQPAFDDASGGHCVRAASSTTTAPTPTTSTSPTATP